MGMEAAHHVADDAGAFLVTLAGIKAQNAHGVNDTPMHRLQPVAHVRQRPAHNSGQRIGEVSLLESGLEIDRLDVTAAGGWID